MHVSLVAFGMLAAMTAVAAGDGPQFNAAGELQFPADYRDWVYLSTGLGMTYGPNAPGALDNPMFDTVYVNPSAWKVFKTTGQWPDKTILVLEIRYSTSNGSINKGGYYQTDVAAIEATVKDEQRFPGKWGYFDFGGGTGVQRQTVKAFAANNRCQQCHSTNGAVDNTFVQFYPTALQIATQRGTVKSSFVPPAASPAQFAHVVREQGWPKGQALLTDAKAKDPGAAVLKEGPLNAAGYGLLQAGKSAEAIAVFRWVAQAYPQSANAHDSLAEALEAGGQKDAALQETEQALALIEKDTTVAAPRKEAIRNALNERIARLRK